MERERVNLMTFKTKLKLAMKDNASWTSYWDALRKFMQAKLTKKELDTYARSVLITDENVGLHNLFIKSIVNNACCGYGPAPPLHYSSTSQTSLSKLKTAGPIKRKGRIASLYGRRPVFNTRSLQTPEKLALRNRMTMIALENGISHVPNEAVLLMMDAIEQHLKTIMMHIRIQKRPQDKNLSVHPQNEKQELEERKVITTLDFLHAIDERPYLLGDNLAVARERALMAL